VPRVSPIRRRVRSTDPLLLCALLTCRVGHYGIAKTGCLCRARQFAGGPTAALAKRIESWGYGALWTPEGAGREVLTSCGWLLANTRSLIVASGIANIYARDAFASAAMQKGLNEQSGGRFLLGLGVSHAYFVEGLRRLKYGKPVATMKTYLEGMAAAAYDSVAPASAPKTVLAALGPKMTELAGQMTDGAHPCNVPPEHTQQAREILGPGKLLCVEQGAILETDASRARRRPQKPGDLPEAAELPQPLEAPGIFRLRLR